MTECQKIEKTRITNITTVYWVSNSKVFHCAPVSPTCHRTGEISM